MVLHGSAIGLCGVEKKISLTKEGDYKTKKLSITGIKWLKKP